MNPQNRTPAEQPSPHVNRVTLNRRIRAEEPENWGSKFSFACSLTAEHPDMPAMSLSTGGASFQVYPTPKQAREMAAMLIELAATYERSQAVRS